MNADTEPGEETPEILVNAAISVDGKLSTRERRQVAISGTVDFDRVDRIRAERDGVMVGVGTVLADDPRLTVKSDQRRADRRESGRPPNPARVVADSRGRTPTDAAVLSDAAETYLLVSEATPDDRREQLREAGATVLVAGEERVDLADGLAKLRGEGLSQLLVEGGGEIIFSLFKSGLVNELSVFVGSVLIGGREAPTLADGEGFLKGDEFPELILTDVERLDEGVVLGYDIRR